MNKEDRGILFKDEYIQMTEVYCSRMNIEDRGIMFKVEYRRKRYIVQEVYILKG